MKKIITFTSLSLLVLSLLYSCDFIRKKTGINMGSESEVPADTLNLHLNSYEKYIEALQSLVGVAEKHGDTEFVEAGLAECEEDIANNKSFLEENKSWLSDEMQAKKDDLDKKYETAKQAINKALNKEKE